MQPVSVLSRRLRQCDAVTPFHERRLTMASRFERSSAMSDQRLGRIVRADASAQRGATDLFGTSRFPARMDPET